MPYKDRAAQNASRRRRYAEDPEYRARMRAYKARWHREHYSANEGQEARLKTRFGLSLEDYVEMARLQCGVCAVCGGPGHLDHLDVDHDHKTGRVRALLCGNCNRALGMVAEDAARLRALAAYAEAA